MIGKKAEQMIEDVSYVVWGNSWWENETQGTEVIEKETVKDIVEVAEKELLQKLIDDNIITQEIVNKLYNNEK